MKPTWNVLAANLLLGAALSASLAGCGTDSAELPAQPDLRPVPVSTNFTASGATVNATVDTFRAALGATNNGANAATTGGRREINWDGVPAGVTNTNAFPADFFNVNSTRGAILSTPGAGLRVADDNFVSVNAAYAGLFSPFSNPKTFAAVGSNVVDVQFNPPGTANPAGVTGFGAVFSDVDLAGPTKMEFFNAAGDLVTTVVVPIRSDASGLSFAGATLTGGQLATRVRITLGNAALSAATVESAAVDLVVADDFFYSEPQAVASRTVKASGDITGAVRAFQIALGNPNNGAGATQVSGRREVNWDGVPAGQTNVNTFPGNFFNVNSTRGILMTTPGTGFRVSDQIFSDVDPSYNARFRTFSPTKIFSAVGSNFIDCSFAQSGTATAANITGFGAVFTDVDRATFSGLQFSNTAGTLLGVSHAPVRSDSIGLSFVGTQFASNNPVGKVRLVLGTAGIGAGVLDLKDGGANDVVTVDDFLYSEPR
jgi:hypothetical protein